MLEICGIFHFLNAVKAKWEWRGWNFEDQWEEIIFRHYQASFRDQIFIIWENFIFFFEKTLTIHTQNYLDWENRWIMNILYPHWCKGCEHAKLLQLCLTLCDPVDCSLPGSSLREILQARILEWVAVSFPRGFSCPRDRTHVSCVSCTGWQVLYH